MPPFDTKMARKHKKGLSDKQARMWAAVARSSYNACMKKNKDTKACEGEAIRKASGAVGPPALATKQRLTVNTALVVPPIAMTLADAPFLTAPAVLIVCGVLNDGLIVEEALIPDAWEFIPVTIGHPRDVAGLPLSAQDPAVLEQFCIGHLSQCRLGTGYRAGHAVRSLQADIWLDTTRVEALGGEALQAYEMLQRQEPLEVSTGFFSVGVQQAGVFLGTPYAEIHTVIEPDHLALLPNSLGACSWSSEGGGCGAPRLHHDATQACGCDDPTHCTCPHEEVTMDADPSVPRLQRLWRVVRDLVTHETPPSVPEPEEDEEREQGTPVTVPAEEEEEDPAAQEAALTTHQTDQDLRQALQACLVREAGQHQMPMWVESVDAVNQFFVYHCGGALCRRYWTVANEVITLLPDIDEVQQDTSFIPVPGTHTTADTPEETGYMAMAATTPPSVIIKTHVNRLIANSAQTGWTEDDRHRLELMDEATLIRLEQLPRHVPVEHHEPTTLSEAIDTMPPHLREMMRLAAEDYDHRKQQAINLLIANTQNPFSEAELQQWDIKRLEKLVVMSGEVVPGQERTPQELRDGTTYHGRRAPVLRLVDTDDADDQQTAPPLPKTMEAVVERQRQLGLRPALG